MSFTKRLALLVCIVALASFAAFGLAGCGDNAATWDHGKVTEDEVSQLAQNELAQFINSDGITYDVDAWHDYIATRAYDSDAYSDSEAGEDQAADGTLEEYRSYLIGQVVRDQVVDYEIEQADIEVSDEELAERVDSYASMYETYYGGGHAGTFESILEVYMGTDLESFTEDVRQGLLVEKYQMQVCGVESADQIDTDKYEAYVDSLMDYVQIKVHDMPDELAYDPAALAAAQEGVVADAAAEDAAAVDEDAAESETDAAEGSENEDEQDSSNQ